MTSIQDDLIFFRNLLSQGRVQAAYRYLLDFMASLRIHFLKAHPEFEFPGNVYQGYMDMTYFSVINPTLKRHRLKIAVVFIYDAFRFEVWLSGMNRHVQAHYWKLLADTKIDHYRLVPDPLKADAIVENIIQNDPDFDHPAELVEKLMSGVVLFMNDMEKILTEIPSAS